MRELPSFHLSQVSVMGKDVPSNYNLVANNTPIEGRVLGNVYKDPGALQPRMIWAAWVRIEAGEMIELGHFGTRQKAALEVAKKWALFTDEIEAWSIEDTMMNIIVKAVEDAQQQREYWGDDSHLAIEYGDQKVILDDEYSDERLSEKFAECQQHVTDLLNGRKTLPGGSWRRAIERFTYGAHMISLELERRERRAAMQRSAKKIELMRESDLPVFCSECRLHVQLHPVLSDPTTENTDEDCCGEYQHKLTLMPSMPSDFSSWGTWRAVYLKQRKAPNAISAIQELQAQDNLVRPDDGALVRSIHEHLVSPWRPTTSVMHELLNAVRELEKLAIENEKRRPASMVVELGDAIDKRVAKLERQHKMLKDRTTMLLAGVVTMLGDDEETLLNLLRTTFAVTEEDPNDELDDDEWKRNPYSLPPASREGVECPACSGFTGERFNGARLLRTVRHEDQATVDECVRRQKLLGWIDPKGRPDLA